MLTSSLLFTCLLSLPQGGEAPPSDKSVPPDPAVAAEKIKVALEEAVAPAVSAIGSLGLIADPRVTKAVAEGLRHKDQGVQGAAIKALRYNIDKSAVAELLKVKTKKKIVEDGVLGAEYYLALGQHRDPRALPVLTKNLAKTKSDTKVIRARLLALGRMRKTASIEALIRFSVSGKQRRNRNDVSMALTALTGEELRSSRRGRGRNSWVQWWSDNRKGYRVAVKEPELPKRVARTWERIWREPGKEPAKRKGKDGKDTGDGKRRRKKDR